METYGPNEAVSIVGGCFVLVIWLAMIVLTAVVFCKIFSKAGYHWALGLIMLIPIGNLIMLCVLAFGQWPIHRELQALKHAQMTPPPEGQPHESFRGN
ncbi:MAG: hypothetical protein H8E62_07875 [Planctomycetes bacterium]|nr:hypothetical protein [Planctomycetota bacterium]